MIHKTLMDWSRVDYLWIFVMFSSAVWTHFDGTHSLQMIHLVRKSCNATFLQICSDEETNSSVSWMAWVNWLNYSLRHFFLFKKIKELFGLRQWFATLKKKPCFSLSCSFTCFFALFIIHFLSIILSISGYLFSWACWFLCAPNAQYLPMHSVSIRWTAEGMHSA